MSSSLTGRRVSSARTPKLSDNSSPLPTPPGAAAAVLLLETVFLLLVQRIGFDFKARRRVFAFEPAINAVFIARMFVMLFLKDRNAFPSKMRICCALAEDAA